MSAIERNLPEPDRPLPAPTRLREVERPKEPLLNPDEAGVQYRLLAGPQGLDLTNKNLPVDTELLGKIKIDGIRGVDTSVHKKASLGERHSYWDEDSERREMSFEKQMEIWEKGLNGYLNKLRGNKDDDRPKKFLEDIGIGEDVGARQLYDTYLKGDSKLDKFVEKLEGLDSTVIMENAEIIKKLGVAFGETSSEAIKHLLHGIKNVQIDADAFKKEAAKTVNEDNVLDDKVLGYINVYSEYWQEIVKKDKKEKEEGQKNEAEQPQPAKTEDTNESPKVSEPLNQSPTTVALTTETKAKVEREKFIPKMRKRTRKVIDVAKAYRRKSNPDEFLAKTTDNFPPEPPIDHSTVKDIALFDQDADSSETLQKPTVEYAAKSIASEEHPNRNEDAVLQVPENKVFGVFDGVGGSAGGDIASQTAKEYFEEQLKSLPPDEELIFEELEDYMRYLVKGAHEAIIQKAEENPQWEGMATTASVVKIWNGPQGERKIIIANAGDSRVYIQDKEGELQQATLDDAAIYEQLDDDSARELQERFSNVTDSLELSNEKERNLFAGRSTITQALGFRIDESFLYTGDIILVDRILITSDGVHDNLTDEEIREILVNSDDNQVAVEKLIEASQVRSRESSTIENIRPKPDDMSAIVIDIPQAT